MDFRWNEWNSDHIARHGVEPEDAEHVIVRARVPYPQRIEDEKWLVWGNDAGGRYLQVIFLLDEDGTVYVIHARPLENNEKRILRRKRR
jgi:uncharacterized DUF497 family protein